jgi:hypothetical protein|tara:strand:- start:117 stop:257 length:141 start_codon:yes stop_codon:yes gene_type:complete
VCVNARKKRAEKSPNRLFDRRIFFLKREKNGVLERKRREKKKEKTT